MDFSGINRNLTPEPREISSLTSAREPGNLSHLWKGLRDDIERTGNAASVISMLRDALTSLGQRQSIRSELFPFKIYHLADFLRTVPIADYDKLWRTVRVRGGLVLNKTADGPMVDGTDLADFPDEEAFVTNADGSLITFPDGTDIEVPESTEKYLIWVEITEAEDGSQTAEIKYGTDPTADGWSSYPSFDKDHVLVGWVDTNTLFNRREAIIRQVQRSDIISGSGADCPP